MNPECRQGKHLNCGGEAWDNEADTLTHCTCHCHENQEGMYP